MFELDNNWDAFWLDMADFVGTKSKCSRAQIGAVIVEKDGKHLVGIGFNGAPKGYPDEGLTCIDFCPRAREGGGSDYSNCPANHAETNSIITSDRARYQEGTIYVNAAVCWDCSKIIANSGISRVVMVVKSSEAHRNPEKSIKFMEQCGLVVDVVRR